MSTGKRPATAPPTALKVARTRHPAPCAGWEALTARDLMRKDLVTVSYADPLSEVERVLTDNRVSGVPVVDEAGAVVGVLSLRDLIQRYAEDPDARPRRGAGFYELSSEELLDEDFESFEVPEESEETAADVMTSEIYAVPADAHLADLAKAMVKHGVHRLLVTDEGRYVGLVGTMEVLRALGEPLKRT